MLSIDLLVDIQDLVWNFLHLVWNQLDDQDQQWDEGEAKDGEVIKEVTEVAERIRCDCLIGIYVLQRRPADDHWADGFSYYRLFGILNDIIDSCILASWFVTLKVSFHLRSQDSLNVFTGDWGVELNKLGDVQVRIDLTVLVRVSVQLIQYGWLRV